MAQDDLNELLRHLAPFARDMLERHGGFHPFAAIMNSNCEVVAIGREPEEMAASSNEQIEAILEMFRELADAGGLRATGIGIDVRTVPPDAREPTDAICIRLEHCENEALDVIIPYRREGDAIEYSEGYASRGPKQVFGAER